VNDKQVTELPDSVIFIFKSASNKSQNDVVIDVSVSVI